MALIFILAASTARAAEFSGASGFLDTDGQSESRPMPRSDDLMPALLYGSAKIPRIEALDDWYFGAKYKKLQIGSDRNGNCRPQWNIIRNAKFNARPVSRDIIKLVETKGKKLGVSMGKFKKALAVYLTNRERIPHQDTIAVIDFDKSSDQERMFVFDLKSGEVSSYKTSHGRGSDPRHSGTPSVFTNDNKTWTSSLGCYIAGGFYSGGNGRSLILHGFEETNYMACKREMVIHGAPEFAKDSGWRSQGCPAVKPRQRDEIFQKLGGGTLVCAYRDKGYHDEAPVMKARKRTTRHKSKSHKRRHRR